MDCLIEMAKIWGLDALADHFFMPFKASALQGYFLKKGLDVSIPQYPHQFKIFIAYQAMEVLYNVALEPAFLLSPTSIQKHLAQFRRILHLMRPGPEEGSKKKTKHAGPPLPATALWIGTESGISFVVFGVGKSGTMEDMVILNAEMERQCKLHKHLNLSSRRPRRSETFFNCSEYRAFLAVSQLASESDKMIQAHCLTITVKKALEMCGDCRTMPN